VHRHRRPRKVVQTRETKESVSKAERSVAQGFESCSLRTVGVLSVCGGVEVRVGVRVLTDYEVAHWDDQLSDQAYPEPADG